jgi:hypothetical protein
MAFLIPESLRNHADVSASVRRVAAGLKNALDDDVIVWFEPLFDPTGQRPHFVVLMPDNGIAVLEVMDVKANKLLGAIRGKIRLERDGRELEVEQPLQRAEIFVEALRERIAVEPRLAQHRIGVEALAVFPNLERETADEQQIGGIVDIERCLFRADVENAVAGDSIGSLNSKLVRILGASASLSGDLLQAVRGVIQPEIVIDPPSDAAQISIFRDPEGPELIRVMDQRQEALAKGLGEGHRVIRGVAGSGKTLVLVYRAKLFAQLFPQHRFLLTCYTRSLAGALARYLADYPNVEVAPLHTLIGRAIRSCSDLTDPGYLADRSGEARAAIGLQSLERGALPRYRAVFIDEAQDFGVSALRFGVGLADERFNDVLIVADAAQNVFGQRFSWKDAGVQAQGRTRILRRNYRNTRQVVEFAYCVVQPNADAEFDPDDETMIIPPESAMREGESPVVIFDEQDAIIDRVVRLAKKHVARTKGASSLAILTMGNSEAIDIERRLRVANIPFFFASDPQNKSNRDSAGSAIEPIVLSTIYTAKGLEFPNVVVSCAARSGQDVNELRMSLYVGMTRATERLTVLIDPAHLLAADVRRAVESD